jgi:NAD(P)-dependent dehydrogenase (short-subunit alcohol dehydrogenase family)
MQASVAIVTGGATGIGRGIATVLSEHGVRVAIVQPTLEQAESGAASIPNAIGLAADIRDADAAEAMVASTESRLGPVDLLVNNAALTGLPAVGAFLTSGRRHVDDLIDVNLKGTVWCSQSVARRMVAAGRPGNIIHIASVGAFAAQEMASIYCATKAAVAMLAQCMALELAPHRIRVNAVAPGDILTEASADITSEVKARGATGQYVRRTPLGRRGTPREIGEVVAFLASEQARFITGETIRVDGGFLTY